MKIIQSEYLVMVDVDDTLVMHDTQGVYEEDIITVMDPLNQKNRIELVPNKNMIRLLREEKSKGATIIVWSRGGYKWANTVVKALGLESCVHMIMTKPLVYFDDKDVTEWMKYRVYIGPNDSYKRTNKPDGEGEQ